MTQALWKCLLFASGLGMLQSFAILTMPNPLLWSNLILWFGFSNTEIILVYIIDLSIKLLPLVLFQVIFGTYLYQRFCSASVYYFSRCPNRIRWFLKESVKLYLLAVLYPLVMVLTTTLIVNFIKPIDFDQSAFLLLIYYVLIHSLWLFITTTLINVLAIMLDSSAAFVIVVGFQLTSVALLLLWENVWPVVDSPNISLHSLLLKFNPIAHLILTWHSSNINLIKGQINQFNLSFDLNETVIIFACLSVFILFIGSLIVKQKEWIVLNQESGGM
ncbi:hypothetical protein J2T56_002492 [Natronobacillus azotifigens]|uniref:Uncharacterized protein n=1 Tax=Natronobacillus azotifigens TaxID=472978 RepID=A0A9J6RFL5_9BACI|nr:hypothetical protein [Natronobacillus azotifigens]MCZ0704196.1 hypothetical protein [Natronobacillus azotifigens]